MTYQCRTMEDRKGRTVSKVVEETNRPNVRFSFSCRRCSARATVRLSILTQLAKEGDRDIYV